MGMTINPSSMQSDTSEYGDSLAVEEETTIDKRDRIKLLAAALATQVVFGATYCSLYNRTKQTVDRTVNPYQEPI
jgi:broad specificity phosphatase PhoE